MYVYMYVCIMYVNEEVPLFRFMLKYDSGCHNKTA